MVDAQIWREWAPGLAWPWRRAALLRALCFDLYPAVCRGCRRMAILG